jgi:glycogen debranching enzyme
MILLILLHQNKQQGFIEEKNSFFKMIIEHNFSNKTLSNKQNNDDQTSFILTNKLGGYASFGISSKYSGLFFNLQGTMFKILDNIVIEGETKKIQNNLSNIKVSKGNFIESFFMHKDSNVFVYELNKASQIDLLFDIKKSYDQRVWGRNYEVYEKHNKIVIKFTKRYDKREDSDEENHDKQEYVLYTVIGIDNSFSYKKNDIWIKQIYSYDQKRNSNPFERYVYNPISVFSKRIIVSVSEHENKAIKEIDYIQNNLAKIKKNQSLGMFSLSNKIKKKEIQFAYNLSYNGLNNLVACINNSHGIYAGLPWFFQFWSRDELISLKPLMFEGKYEIVKEILNRILFNIDKNGNISNQSKNTGTMSIDAIGFVFQRYSDFFEILKKEKKLGNVYNKNEIKEISDKFEQIINGIIKNKLVNGFLVSKVNETWMDSVYSNDTREGARIEIQALLLKMYKFTYILTKKAIYKKLENSLKKNILKYFLKDDYLYDGIDDPTIRPNLFIAAYIYPTLLTKLQWKKCIKKILPHLWLDFGGITSIDKNSELFCENHTGEDSRSYHRGDSWFWVNNLTALVLHKIDAKEYKKYIDQILNASCNEILYSGIIGQHAELTSASKLKSEGCLAQAWSNAMFVELIHELYENTIVKKTKKKS